MVHLVLVADCQAAVEANTLIAYISVLPLSVPVSSVPYFLSSLASFSPSHTYAHTGGLTIVPVKSKTDYSVQNRPETSWMYNVVAQHQMLPWSDRSALMFSFFSRSISLLSSQGFVLSVFACFFLPTVFMLTKGQ